MKLTLKRVCCIVFAIYCIGTCYTAYLLIARNLWSDEDERTRGNRKLPEDDLNWNPWGLDLENGLPRAKDMRRNIPTFHLKNPVDDQVDDEGDFKIQENQPTERIVEVWGKAAIGNFFWEHIFGAGLDSRLNGVWSYGEKQVDNIIFRFRAGPGVTPAKVPQDTEHAVLILNGRESSKMEFAKMWLDYLPLMRNLKNVIVVMLGNEECDNDWILPYMGFNGGLLSAVFLVYDSHMTDDINFFQWPLGVATYRGFPFIDPSEVNVNSHRNFKCNYLGTIYKNSSRESLLRVLNQEDLRTQCYVKPRYQWLPQETTESLADYMEALRESDLTLNPVGKNTECYRIYEALSLGSVPVIEDRMTPGSCGQAKPTSRLGPVSPPLRLLKYHGAPFVFVSDWEQLREVLRREAQLTDLDIARRRRNVLNWYKGFLNKMHEHFVAVVKQKFFNELS